MADELIETGIKYEKRVNGTRNSVRKVPTVKTGLYLFPLFPGIFQWDEPTKRFPFSTESKFPKILTKWKAPTVFVPREIKDNGYAKFWGENKVH